MTGISVSPITEQAFGRGRMTVARALFAQPRTVADTSTRRADMTQSSHAPDGCTR